MMADDHPLIKCPSCIYAEYPWESTPCCECFNIPVYPYLGASFFAMGNHPHDWSHFNAKNYQEGTPIKMPKIIVATERKKYVEWVFPKDVTINSLFQKYNIKLTRQCHGVFVNEKQVFQNLSSQDTSILDKPISDFIEKGVTEILVRRAIICGIEDA